MRKLQLVLLLLPSIIFAQSKKITLEEIWQGQFRENHLQSFNAMNGDFYSLLNYNSQTKSNSIDIYSYATLEKTKSILDSKNFTEIDHISDYSFNANESKILIATNTQGIYRHSSKSIFYIYDVVSKKIVLVDKNPIQEPTFSPDSKKVAYVKQNNIFIKNLQSNTTKQITTDGSINNIINGITDWVYEEEFAFVKAFQWSGDANQIAYLKFDERNVPEYSMDIVGGQLYPSASKFKYPKAGEKNSEVSLHVYNTNLNNTTKIDLGDYEYIPHLKWTKDDNTVCAITLNRHQNHLKLNFINTQNNQVNVILEEIDKAYVDLDGIDNLTFLSDNSFIWSSEKDGNNHLYHYNKTGKLKKQITKGNWDVTSYYGLNKKTKTIFYQSVEDGSINRTIYSIRLNGKSKKRISQATGTNSADFSKNKAYFILKHSDANTPVSYTLHNAKKALKEIKNNKALSEKLNNYQLSKKEYSEIATKDGSFNMWMLKPVDFDASKKYPMLMVQYSGPGSQMVANSWNSYNDYWYQMLAQKGYIIVCVDGRGTGFKGAAFKKVTYKELGKYEVIDQIEVAKELRKRTYIDGTKIGIWGWSYGGFMASNCILKGEGVFSTAIAVAPVTSWRYYDSIYTERYMRTPQENPDGYDENSPLFHAEKLKGNYLIVHGTGDDNVHVQNTYQMTNALVKANKQFDQAIYPDRAHGIYRGRNTRLHLFTKMTNYLDSHLK